MNLGKGQRLVLYVEHDFERWSMKENLPVALACVCPVSNTKPVRGSRLSHATIQQQRYGQHLDIANVARVDKHLLAPCGQRFPVFDSLLCSDIWGDHVDVQIVGDTGLRKLEFSISLLRKLTGGKVKERILLRDSSRETEDTG